MASSGFKITRCAKDDKEDDKDDDDDKKRMMAKKKVGVSTSEAFGFLVTVCIINIILVLFYFCLRPEFVRTRV